MIFQGGPSFFANAEAEIDPSRAREKGRSSTNSLSRLRLPGWRPRATRRERRRPVARHPRWSRGNEATGKAFEKSRSNPICGSQNRLSGKGLRSFLRKWASPERSQKSRPSAAAKPKLREQLAAPVNVEPGDESPSTPNPPVGVDAPGGRASGYSSPGCRASSIRHSRRSTRSGSLILGRWMVVRPIGVRPSRTAPRHRKCLTHL